MSDQELAPCLFCDGNSGEAYVKGGPRNGNIYHVRCGCLACGPMRSTPDEAVAAWNAAGRRAADEERAACAEIANNVRLNAAHSKDTAINIFSCRFFAGRQTAGDDIAALILARADQQRAEKQGVGPRADRAAVGEGEG